MQQSPSPPTTLAQKLNDLRQQHGSEFFSGQVPAWVHRCLRAGLRLRPFQQEAAGRFIFDFNQWQRQPSAPLQRLFHMATGSGKTVVMAALLPFLFRQGYRNVLFFVNSTNILHKTRANFLDPASSKFLFARETDDGQQRFRLVEGPLFAQAPGEMRIFFTTIQGLHAQLNRPVENSLVYSDFNQGKTLLISDEAHHLNTLTRQKHRLRKSERTEAESWEQTVARVLKAHPANLLLEFTATAGLHHPAVAKKYHDKLLFNYPLAQFCSEGYSKAVSVCQSAATPVARALQAILLSEYRRKLFAASGLQVKPVVLFKSRTIALNREFYKELGEQIDALAVHMLQPLWQQMHQRFGLDTRLFPGATAFLEQLCLEIQSGFSAENRVCTDSSQLSEQQQTLLNSLEDSHNPVRAIFAVDKLNEGWDVLNLFDIVRLYETRTARKTGQQPATVAEAQLIGRGARYFPFGLAGGLPRYQRQFDADALHPMRLCEQLVYHTASDPLYLKELEQELQASGLPLSRQLQVTFSEDFKAGWCYRYAQVPVNGLLQQVASAGDFPQVVWQQPLQPGISRADRAKCRPFGLVNLGLPVLRKALQQLPFYRFDLLKKRFPALQSTGQLLQAPGFMGNLQLLYPDDPASLPPPQRLQLARAALSELSALLENALPQPAAGTALQLQPLQNLLQENTRSVSNPVYKVAEWPWLHPQSCSLSDKQRHFAQWFQRQAATLQGEGSQLVLLKNEGFFRWYAFAGGTSLRPDFLLLRPCPGQRQLLATGLHISTVSPDAGAFYRQASQQYHAFNVEGQTWQTRLDGFCEGNASRWADLLPLLRKTD